LSFNVEILKSRQFLPIIDQMEQAETADRRRKLASAEAGRIIPITRRRSLLDLARRSHHFALRSFGLGLLVAMIPTPSLRSADFYLARLGPPPLRFAAAPLKPKDFAWPLAPGPARALTNSMELAGDTATNSSNVLPNATGPATSSNGAPGTEVTVTASPSSTFPTPSISIGFDGNPLSASNLLVVTPQMLADYFKANYDGTYRPTTNGFNGIEVPFYPPTPKAAPSSEAIYRTQ
jgi:hypothetical protein